MSAKPRMMQRLLGWVILTCLSAYTVFEGMLLCLVQFGEKFTMGHTDPDTIVWIVAWLIQACALMVAWWFPIPLVIIGVVEFVHHLVLRNQFRGQSFFAALTNSWPEAAFVALAICYMMLRRCQLSASGTQPSVRAATPGT